MPTSPDPARFQPDAVKRALPDALALLYDLHGQAPTPDGQEDLLATLIATILSQSTTNINSERAFASLIDTFQGDWSLVRAAPVDRVVEAIRCGGLAKQKAPRIIAILQTLHEEGLPDLEHLRALPAADALDALLAYPGVGPKTARFVLMWGAAAPLFAMDTHILRIMRRLGWLPPGTSDARAHTLIEPLIPEGQHWSAHIAFIDHGRSICHAQHPECTRCPLAPQCPHLQRALDATTPEPG
jgi:endonuclease III